LLTGASGFVGSHILDCLRAREIPATVLLRRTSDRRFLEQHLPAIEVREGSITDRASLPSALAGISHVIHCAGCTKAVTRQDYHAINHLGTLNLLEAVGARQEPLERFVHISSLAAAGPSTAGKPRREFDAPEPVSEYGKSKLAAEIEVRNHCQATHVILRPPAVFGPRDREFLPIFKSIRHHLLPRPSATQALSLVFVRDLAEAAVSCLTHPNAPGRTFFISNREIVSGRAMAEEAAVQMARWTIPFPLPTAALWPVCLISELVARLTGRASMLNLQKFAELRAPGWVCDGSLAERELGLSCATGLKRGITETLGWYQQHSWL